jgi:hypothetical protein
VEIRDPYTHHAADVVLQGQAPRSEFAFCADL